MSLNPAAIPLVLIACWLCPLADAQILFDGPADPSLVYPGTIRYPTSQSSRRSSLPSIKTLSIPKPVRKTDEAWVSWYAGIDNEMAKRFASFTANHNFGSAQVVVNYSVGNDRQIKSLSFDTKSSDAFFNTVARVLVESMSKNPILQFPDCHDGSDVQMQATFNGTGISAPSDSKI